jgi:hypothetical protein
VAIMPPQLDRRLAFLSDIRRTYWSAQCPQWVVFCRDRYGWKAAIARTLTACKLRRNISWRGELSVVV